MSTEMSGMSFEEQRKYIEQHASRVRGELDLQHDAAAAPHRLQAAGVHRP
jgi:hypothetical protein